MIAFCKVVKTGLEFGNPRPLLTLKRIQIGPARTQCPIGSNQLLNMHLATSGCRISTHLAGLQGSLAGPLGKRLHHWRMGHIARVRVGAGGRDQLHLVKISSPAGRHRCRVVEIRLVELFDVGGVTPKKVGIFLKRFHEHLVYPTRHYVYRWPIGSTWRRTLPLNN